MDSASSDGGGGYVIGEEVAKRKMISQSSGGNRLGVCRWLAALVVDSVVAVTMVMVSIDIMVFFVSCMKICLVVYNDDEMRQIVTPRSREIERLIQYQKISNPLEASARLPS